MTTIAKTEDFYNWFKDVGGNMVTQDPEELNKNLHPVPLQRSSTLKIDPERIKRLYNYKFKKNDPY